jgi:hypothetical protein
MYPTITPLVSGVPKSENFLLFTCVHVQMLEGLFNSQIHAGRCFQIQEKPLEYFGSGRGVRWCSKV